MSWFLDKIWFHHLVKYLVCEFKFHVVHMFSSRFSWNSWHSTPAWPAYGVPLSPSAQTSSSHPRPRTRARQPCRRTRASQNPRVCSSPPTHPGSGTSGPLETIISVPDAQFVSRKQPGQSSGFGWQWSECWSGCRPSKPSRHGHGRPEPGRHCPPVRKTPTGHSMRTSFLIERLLSSTLNQHSVVVVRGFPTVCPVIPSDHVLCRS